MKKKIAVRDYRPEDVQTLANIFFNTIHKINIQHYTEEQVDVWAPTSSLEVGKKIFQNQANYCHCRGRDRWFC